MRDRRGLLRLGPATLAASVVWSRALAQTKLPRIGTLLDEFGGAFEDGLRALGYVDGVNIVIDRRVGGGAMDDARAKLTELVRLKPDLLVIQTTPIAFLARQMAPGTPLVVQLADPVAAGLADSLARPGRDVTGIASMAQELGGKRLAMIRDIIGPGVQIVLLHTDPPPMGSLQVHSRAAVAASVMLTPAIVRRADEIDAVVALHAAAGAKALTTTTGPFFTENRAILLAAARRWRLLDAHDNREFAEEGAAIAYAANNTDVHRRLASFVDRILKGAKPGEIPFEQPTRFQLILNRKTIEALGYTIPPSLLGLADEVIE